MQIVLEHVAKKLKFDLPEEASQQIAEDSGGNMRKALLVFEALKMQSYVQSATISLLQRLIVCRPDLSGSLTIAKPDWEIYCHKVADLIVQEQSPARVLEVRAKLYELLAHCIPPTIILKVSRSVQHTEQVTDSVQTVAERVVERVDEAMKADVMHWAAFYVRGRRLNLSVSYMCTGDPNATWQQKDLSLRGLGSEGHELIQGRNKFPPSLANTDHNNC